MKKSTIALVTIPAILMGTLAFAGSKYHDDDNDCRGERGDRHEKSDRHHDRGDRGERMVERMTKKLELTAEQQTSLKDLFQAKADQRVAMKDKNQALHETLRNLDPTSETYAKDLQTAKDNAAALAIARIDERTTMQADIAKILTPEQLTKLQEEMGERGERRYK